MATSLLLSPVFTSSKKKKKLGDDNKLVVIALFATKKWKKKERWQHICVITFFISNKRRSGWRLLCFKQKKRKKTQRKKKCKEGRELTFLLLLLRLGWSTPFAFFSPRSFNVKLSTFLKPYVSRLLKALCYSSLGALLSSRDRVSRKWGEGGKSWEVGRREVRRGEVGRRGKFWGKEGGWKIPGQGKRMWFLVHPQNSLNDLILTGALLAAGSLQPLGRAFQVVRGELPSLEVALEDRLTQEI